MRGKGRKWETGEEREESIAGGLDKNQGRVLLQQLCAAIAKSLVPCFPKHECMTTLIMRTETDSSGTTYAQVIFPDVHVNEEVHKAARGHVLEDVASQQVAQDLLKVHPSNSLDAVVKPLSDAVTNVPPPSCPPPWLTNRLRYCSAVRGMTALTATRAKRSPRQTSPARPSPPPE